MDTLLEGLIEPAILDRIPGWAITFVVIVIVLSRTGILNRWAISLSALFHYIKAKGQLEADQERWEAEREAELDRIQVDAIIQAQVARQLSDQRAQQQLYNILEGSLKFMQDELGGEVSRLNQSIAVLNNKVNEIEKVVLIISTKQESGRN